MLALKAAVFLPSQPTKSTDLCKICVLDIFKLVFIFWKTDDTDSMKDAKFRFDKTILSNNQMKHFKRI